MNWLRCARRQEHWHPDYEQRLAWRVQDVLAGCGLSMPDYSIGGGRVVRVPRVVSVDTGPPAELDIRLLIGQTPENVADQAQAIAYNLGVAGIWIIPLAPSLIRLRLLSEPDRGSVSVTASP